MAVSTPLPLPLVTTARSSNCRKCDLSKTRTTICDGAGPRRAPLMVIAEAPGQEEDLTGTPFVGQSGRLLRATLAAAGIDTDRLYCTNIVRCRPPDNRDPLPDEIDACFGWLSQEVARVRPQVVLTLGKIAHDAIQPLLPTFDAMQIAWTWAAHPAFILRSPGHKPAWERVVMNAARLALGRPIPRLPDEIDPAPWDEGTVPDDPPWLAADTETDDLEEGVGVRRVAWTLSDGTHAEFRTDPPPRFRHLWLHNAKYDLPLLDIDAWDVDSWDDTMLIAYLLRRWPRIGLKELTPKITGIKMYPISAILGQGKKRVSFSQALAASPDQCRDYAMRDALATSRLAQYLWGELEAEPTLLNLYQEVEKPLVPVLLGMEQRGVLVDEAALRTLDADLSARITDQGNALRDTLGLEMIVRGKKKKLYTDPLSSPKVLSPALVDAGVPLRDKTLTGQLCTDQAALLAACRVSKPEELDPNDPSHALVAGLLDWRELKKMRSTYVVNLLTRRDAEGRIHARFNQAVAGTGRLSSSEPNLQNIPVRTELGRRIRRVFIAKPGHVIVKGDYSQLEVRIYAHFTREPVLLAAYPHDGPAQDVHQGVADALRIPRKAAKNVLFGAIYGAAPPKLAETAGVPRERAGEFLSNLRESLPSLLSWQDRIANQLIRNKGFVTTLMGRREYYPEFLSPITRDQREALRQAANFPIQGSAADLVKVLMNRAEREVAPYFEAGLLIQAHDELVYEVPRENVREFARILADLGNHVGLEAGLIVPLEFSMEAGDTWGSTTPISEWSE